MVFYQKLEALHYNILYYIISKDPFPLKAGNSDKVWRVLRIFHNNL
jgi:hypothetical protein